MTVHGNDMADTGDNPEAQHFPLLRRLSIASLLAMLVTAVTLILLYRHDQISEHNEISKQHSQIVARRLLYLLDSQINTFITASDKLPAQSLQANPNLALLRDTQGIVREFEVLKLEIYNLHGTVLYSSAEEDIGKTSSQPELLAKALRGEVASQAEFLDTLSTQFGTEHDTYVALTYMPLTHAGKRTGVLGVYEDVTPAYLRIRSNTVSIAAIVIAAFASLYAALYFYARRTDRAVAEWQNRVIRSERKFHMLFDTISDPIFIACKDGHLLQANSSACERLGYSLQELQKMGTADVNTSAYAARAQERINSIFEQGNAVFESELKCRDGSVIPVELNARLVYYENKFVILGIARDMSVRKNIEQELVESLHKLEERAFAKTRFLAAASHDMRQPIAAASLLVKALELTSPNAHQSRLIAQLEQSMGIFSDMLNRLLDISRFDAGLVKPQVSSFGMEEILLWLDQNFARTALDKQLRFRLFFPTRKALIVHTDFGLVQSVLMNLVSNAIKYTERGSILVSARQRGSHVLIQVWDTGIGIAGMDLPHIFEEFYQVSNPQRNREGGLGLGLSICQRAMAVLQSKIICRSRPGHGSVFEFSLPLNGENDPPEPLPASAALPVNTASEKLFHGKNVVLVEDDDLVASAMTSLLEGMGGKVTYFHSAEDALGHAHIEQADYYIVDYMLDGALNGIQFLELLRQQTDKPAKAVLLTGDTSTDFIQKAELLDWPVLHKPVNISRLITIFSTQARHQP